MKSNSFKDNFLLSQWVLFSYTRKLYKILLLIICTTLFLCACAKNQKGVQQIERDKVNIGLVVTTSQDYDSKIMWFDSKLNLQNEQFLGYAMLGTPFDTPVENNGKLYMIPQGLVDRKDTKKVISIDKETLNIEEYPFSNIALNHMASLEDNVYAVNTLDGNSYIELYNTRSKNNKIIKKDGEYIYAIIATDNKLFGFSLQFTNNNMLYKGILMRVYSPDLQLLKEVDITKYGITTSKYFEDDTNIYITVNCDINDEPLGKIIKINKINYHIEEIVLKENYPNDIYKYKDNFLITYYDPIQKIGSKISILDGSGKEKYIDLGIPLTLTGILGDNFFVANDFCIRIYSLNDFRLIKEYKVNLNSKSYVSSLLFLE